MDNLLIIGNPNVGKTTFFNTITKSNEHTGNFHGVTVEEKAKIITLNNKQLRVLDLPGLYSLNSFSQEEVVSRNAILDTKGKRIIIIDANSLRKNLYLCLQLIELGLDFKIVINNYKYFESKGNRIDYKLLSKRLGVEVELIDAKKFRLNREFLSYQFNPAPIQYIDYYIDKINKDYSLGKDEAVNVLNGINKQEEGIKKLQLQIIQDRYDHIDKILKDCISINTRFVYGLSRFDRLLLKPIILMIGFILAFFASIYVIYFLIGNRISDILSLIFENVLVIPIMKVLVMIIDNVWVLEFFENGVFASIGGVLGFLPQICLVYVFLTILEDSGLVARLSYLFDDVLSSFGLNGKAIYLMMLGLGCNTMATTTTRNISDKSMKVRSAIVNPYISCMARLPVYLVIISAFFSQYAFLMVAGLYVLGIMLALIMSMILSKTIVKSINNSFLLEFPPLRGIDIKHILSQSKKNAVEFISRVFSVVLSVGVIVWILTHTTFALRYTSNMFDSILFIISSGLTSFFSPIGFDSAGIILALITGIMAKELIISTMSIVNNVNSSHMLSLSLLSTSSIIHFSPASAVSFLIFSLIYCPCVSNLAILKKETDSFYMWFAIISQFTLAYILSFTVYQSLVHGVGYALIVLSIILIILFAIIFTSIRLKKYKCINCNRCHRF